MTTTRPQEDRSRTAPKCVCEEILLRLWLDHHYIMLKDALTGLKVMIIGVNYKYSAKYYNLFDIQRPLYLTTIVFFLS
jgi:hypothetical protein